MIIKTGTRTTQTRTISKTRFGIFSEGQEEEEEQHQQQQQEEEQ